MTANYTDTGIDLEIHETATLASLIWLRERVQSHIDALTPTLAETQQTGPVQVVENEPKWSEWFSWSGGTNPVMGCRIQCTLTGERTPEKADFEPYHANSYSWAHSAHDDRGNITRYRVLLSSIPTGYCLYQGKLVNGMPEGGE